MYPKGNVNTKQGNGNTKHLALYLDLADSEGRPFQGTCNASFKLVLHSQYDSKLNIVKGIKPCSLT